jgi:hypothetical protein
LVPDVLILVVSWSFSSTLPALRNLSGGGLPEYAPGPRRRATLLRAARFQKPLFPSWTMSLRFDGRAFAALLLLTAVEALIATVGKPYPWLRGFVGDVLAVGWVYLVFRSFIRAGVLPLAVAALLTGYAVEFGQYLARLYGWQIKQPLLRILLGSVPDWWDVLAYTVGFFLVLALAGWRRRGGRVPAGA